MAFKHFWVQYKLGGDADQAYVKAESFVIGRAPECDLPIPTDVLSRRHLKVYLEDDIIYIMDLGSTNGTYLQGERLAPNQKYEYKTGNRLYLDAGKECSLRITAIFKKDMVDMDLEQRGIELEKQKRHLRGKGKVNRQLKDTDVKENFIVNATENVDNIFENLIYIAKSARFNKERKIREAENMSHEMLEKAKKEIESNRVLLEKELVALQQETKKEAKRIITVANEKSEGLVKKAENKARKIREEAQSIKEKSQANAESAKREVLERAEEKHGQIIADAYLKNKELKEENEKIDASLSERRKHRSDLEREIENLKVSFQEHEEKTRAAKEQYAIEEEGLNSLKAKVVAMERRNNEAIDALETKIPNLEKKAGELNKDIFDADMEIKKKETELERFNKTIQQKLEELDKNVEKCEASEKRLDELAVKMSEAEDNLFRLSKIKQQRNEEIDREIADRRLKQKQSEERTLEKLSKKKERIEKEIEINLKNAKEKAQSIINEADQESKAILMDAKDDASLKIEEAQKKADEIIASAEKSQEEVDLEITSRRRNFDLEIEEEKDTLLANVRKDAQEARDNAQKEADKIVAEAKKKAGEIMDEVKGKADQDLDSLQKEIENRKKETDEEIQGIRQHAVKKMEEQKQLFEKEEGERNRIRVLKLHKELDTVLRARITPFLKSEEQMDKVGKIISKSINVVMLDEVDDEIFDAENYSDIDPTLAQGKVKKFYMYGGAGVILLVLFFVFLPKFKEVADESGRQIAAEIERKDQERIERAKKENDLSAAFNPKMKDEFLDSYTDRVLYTKNYIKLELDPGFKKQWLLELQDFFVDELKVNEIKVAPFIAREGTMLQELSDARAKINGNFVDESRKRMQEIEANFISHVKESGIKKKDLKKIMKFKKKFFEENKELFSN